MIEFSVCGPSEYSTGEQLTLGGSGERFFEGLKNYIQNKNDGNENKIIHEDFSCTIDKIGRDDENKTQRV